MIIDTIITAFLAALEALFTLLPSFTLPEPESMELLFTSFLDLDRIIPVRAILLILVAHMAVQIGIRGWDFVLFVYHQFWGSS